jgi:hypothetical protein
MVNKNEPGKLIDIQLNEFAAWISYKKDNNEFKAFFLMIMAFMIF